MIADHLSRLRAGIYATFSLDQAPQWICKKTRIKGKPYSFVDHEFQETILSDTSTEVNTQKCSQIGLSEAQARWTLAVTRIMPAFSTIYTMPFAGDATIFCRTRVDPIIAGSDDLKFAVNPELNNSETKQFGDSFIYFRGTQGATQAISTPADAIVSDEIDRSDPAVLTQFASRLTHSPYKLRRNFSTPTVEGYGIALKMKTSRRFRNLCKCHHCNEWFVPSYFDHVKIPGYDGDLRDVDKATLAIVRHREAALLCPKCGLQPNLAPQYRSWVQENTLELHDAAGYYVSPFDAPKIITPAYLVKVSADYSKYSEFINQNLGLTAIDTEESLILNDLVQSTVPNSLTDTGVYAMGADMGLICRICIGRMVNGMFYVVHRERVPLGQFEERVKALSTQFRVVVKVFDSQPYVDLIMRMQTTDYNLYAAVFVTSKNVEAFTIKQQEEDEDKGKLDVRQVQVNRNKAFDELMGQIKWRVKRDRTIEPGRTCIAADEKEEDAFRSELLDMKRVQKLDKNFELNYVWVKSPEAQDHYHHALLYLYIAARIGGLAQNVFAWPSLVSSFRQKSAEEIAREKRRGQ